MIKSIIVALLCLPAVLFATAIQAKGVPAGTVINNTVIVTAKGIPEYGLRASTEFTVAEVLNLDLVSLDTQHVSTPTPASQRILTFQLSNTGNGTETFKLSHNANVTGDDFDPVVESVWLESNGVPGFQQGEDTLYQADIDAITLQADESVVIYVSSNIPASLAHSSMGHVLIKATSTSNGVSQYKAGDAIADAGDNGIELVLLKDKGQTSAEGVYQTASLTMQLSKSVDGVVDPFGGERVMPGSQVTYKIEFSASGEGNANNMLITDPTPANMTYKNGSMKLNNMALTDSDDSDEADFGISQENTASFKLGTVTSSDTYQFFVTYIVN